MKISKPSPSPPKQVKRGCSKEENQTVPINTSAKPKSSGLRKISIVLPFEREDSITSVTSNLSPTNKSTRFMEPSDARSNAPGAAATHKRSMGSKRQQNNQMQGEELGSSLVTDGASASTPPSASVEDSFVPIIDTRQLFIRVQFDGFLKFYCLLRFLSF